MPPVPAPRFEDVLACPACGDRRLGVLDAAAGLSACRACRFVFASPRPTLDALTEYYSAPAKYDGWLAEERERDALWRRRLRIIERYRKPGTLLDVGTGTGQFLAVARSSFTRVLGTEISRSAIDIARDRYGVEVVPGPLGEAPLAGRVFDNVSLFHVLEHVHDPKAYLDRCRELLAEGGMIFVAVPNDLRSWELGLKTFVKRRAGRLPAGTGARGIPRLALDGSVDEIHLSQFTQDTLGRLMGRCGFEPVALTLDPYFVRRGFRLTLHRLYYRAHLAIHRVSGVNGYNAILAVGRRRGTTP
jgi:SAM-dependent methyltransferase